MQCLQRFYFGVGSNISVSLFIKSCSPIIHKFMPEKSFDLVYIGVSNREIKERLISNVTNVSL